MSTSLRPNIKQIWDYLITANKIYVENGIPDPGLGNIGDIYIDDSTVYPTTSTIAYYFYVKTALTTWTFKLPLRILSSGAAFVDDTAFGASWNGVTDIAPSKNAVYDAIVANTLSLGTDNQIPYINTTGDDFDYDANFTWDGKTLKVTDGSNSVLIGNNAGNSTSSGAGGVYIGNSAGFNSTARANTFIGHESGYSNISGQENTFLGFQSGYSNTAGGNTYVGDAAGYSNIVGTGNVFLGRTSGYSETGSNKLFIDNQFRTNEATARTSSLIHGEFNATVASQWLRINGQLELPQISDTATGEDDKILFWDSTLGKVTKGNLSNQTSIASSTTPTPTGNYRENEYYLTALAAAATFAAPSGTPANGNTLLIRIEDDGTARTLAWNAIYEAVGVTLPTTTVLSKKMYVRCIYNSTDSKWDVVSVVQEA